MFPHDLTKIQTITLHIKQTHKKSNGILCFGCLEKSNKRKITHFLLKTENSNIFTSTGVYIYRNSDTYMYVIYRFQIFSARTHIQILISTSSGEEIGRCNGERGKGKSVTRESAFAGRDRRVISGFTKDFSGDPRDLLCV